MVYVISKPGKALMPTSRHRKVRLWLKSGKAKVVSHTPFTIQLLFETRDVTQDLTLGMDTGFETVGVSVVSEKKEVFSAEIQLRKDVSDRMTERRMYRRNRRNRLWHRKPRFLNRKKTQVLAPSVKQKVDLRRKFFITYRKTSAEDLRRKFFITYRKTSAEDSHYL